MYCEMGRPRPSPLRHAIMATATATDTVPSVEIAHAPVASLDALLAGLARRRAVVRLATLPGTLGLSAESVAELLASAVDAGRVELWAEAIIAGRGSPPATTPG